MTETEPMRPDGKVKCDTCDGQASRYVDATSCEYVAWWFLGHYCSACYDLAVAAFRAACEAAKRA